MTGNGTTRLARWPRALAACGVGLGLAAGEPRFAIPDDGLTPEVHRQQPTFQPDPKLAVPEQPPPPTNRTLSPFPTPLYGTAESLPIDLPTALRLANASNPTVNLARARAAEAQFRLQRASVLWLPSLAAGTTYFRSDGNTQNQRGEVFAVSRSNLFVNGGTSLRVDASDAYFLPLVAARLADAASLDARGVNIDVQLDVALTYLDLVQVHGLLAINTDTLARAEQMLEAARAGDKAGLNRTTADVNRAATEVNVRREERMVLKGRLGAVSARLARLLLLKPTVDLVPADRDVVPVALVPPDCTLDDLVGIALANRPDLGASRATADAADTRVRQATTDPLLPRLQVDYAAGTFGGGRNSDLREFDGRSVVTAGVYWELDNLGLGNVARIRTRRAERDQAIFRVQEVQAVVGAEVSEAAKFAAARYASLATAQDAVREATEMYRRLAEASFGMAGRRPEFDALQVLLAIQALNQARVLYLNEVLEFNRAQFRLYAAMGNPPLCGLDSATAEPQPLSAVPPPPTLPKPGSPEKPNP